MILAVIHKVMLEGIVINNEYNPTIMYYVTKDYTETHTVATVLNLKWVFLYFLIGITVLILLIT